MKKEFFIRLGVVLTTVSIGEQYQSAMQITPITHISFPEDPLLYVTESLDNYFDRAEEKTLQKPELFWNFQNCQFYYLRLD